MLTTVRHSQKNSPQKTYSPNSTEKSAPNAGKGHFSLKPDAGTANHVGTITVMQGGEKSMYDICIIIIILVLSGIALVANVAVCIYTLHLAKQSEHRQYMEGFTSAFINYEMSNDKDTKK